MFTDKNFRLGFPCLRLFTRHNLPHAAAMAVVAEPVDGYWLDECERLLTRLFG